MAKEYLEKLSIFIDMVAATCAEETSLECRHFFSGAALYVNNKICTTLTPGGLAIKLPESTRTNLFRNNQAIPLRYFSGGPVKKEYALFSQGIDNVDDDLIAYVKQGIDHVLRMPQSKPAEKQVAEHL